MGDNYDSDKLWSVHGKITSPLPCPAFHQFYISFTTIYSRYIVYQSCIIRHDLHYEAASSADRLHVSWQAVFKLTYEVVARYSLEVPVRSKKGYQAVD